MDQRRVVNWVTGCVAACGWAILIGGCGPSMPAESLAPGIGADELRTHVEFLAGPDLAGRAPNSRGSRYARRYIESRFESYGLKPWGQAKGFAQPFHMGTNVVGVLEGTQPNPEDGMILVCAHYDHQGKDDKGLIHPGAVDNASGVAALLEIAEALATSPHRPRRSVVFACFDCEEQALLGSVAFTCREDFDHRRLAAVLDIDMLGRASMDVMGNTLLVTGTEGFPPLRQGIAESAQGKDVQLLWLSSALVGPFSDHSAFLYDKEGPPCVMFSCGYYEDYHKPTDTPDKLDYPAAAQQARLVLDTIEKLDQHEPGPRQAVTAQEQQEEFQSIRRLLLAMSGDPDRCHLDAQFRQQMPQLLADLDQCLQTGLAGDLKARLQETMWRYDPASGGKPLSNDMAMFMHLLCDEPEAVMRIYRQMISKAMQNRWRLAVLGRMQVKGKTLLAPRPRVQRTEDGGIELSVLLTQVQVSVTFRRFGGTEVGVVASLTPRVFRGSQDQFEDALMLWSCSGLPQEGFDVLVSSARPDGPRPDAAGMLDECVKHSGSTSVDEWILAMARCPNPSVATATLGASQLQPAQRAQAVLAVLSQPDLPAWAASDAVRAATRQMGPEVLGRLADLLGDQRLVDNSERMRMLSDPTHPCQAPWLQALLKQENMASVLAAPPKPLSDEALDKLKQLTGQDLGKDQAAWTAWIRRNR